MSDTPRTDACAKMHDAVKVLEGLRNIAREDYDGSRREERCAALTLAIDVMKTTKFEVAPLEGETPAMDMTANVKLAEMLEARHWQCAGSAHQSGCCCPACVKFRAIIAALRSTSQAQGTYSIEDIDAWDCWNSGQGYSVCDPTFGIAAWKSRQLAGGK